MPDHRVSGRVRPDSPSRRRLSPGQVITAILVLLLATVATFVARDSRSTPEIVPNPPAGLQPAPGGTYVEGDVGEPTTFNPLLSTQQSEQDVSRLVFSTLTRVDGAGVPQPEIAERWSVSDDGLTYTFTLRDDVRWHDGRPLTSRDVIFTINVIQSPSFPGDQSLARFWRGVLASAPDDHTVVFTLLEPFAAFPNYAAVPILPSHLLGGVLPEDLPTDPFSMAPVGSGPFRFVSYDRENKVVTLARFDGYFGERAYLDEVQFRFFDSTDELLAALRAGSIDGSGSVPAAQVLRPGGLPRDVVVYAPSMSGFAALFYNLRHPIFSSVEVRQALALAIDRQQILSGPLREHAEVGTGPIPPSSWAYVPQQPAHDPDAAVDLLEQAGWTDADGDGVREKGSERLSFTLLVNDDDPQRIAVAEEISGELARIGVQAGVEARPSDQVTQALATRQFTAAVFGWHSASGDPDCYQLWHSSGADDGLNFSGLRNEDIDRLLEEARQTSDTTKRKELYAEFQQRFAEQMPAVVLYYPRYYFAVSASVYGIEPTPIIRPSDRFNGLPHWFVETAEPGTPDGGG